MPELHAPLRITWELPADPAQAAAHWRALTEARVLFVEVAASAAAVEGLLGVADLLGVAGAPRVTLVAAAPTLHAALTQLPQAAVAGLELLVLPPFDAVVPEALAGVRARAWALWSSGEGLAAFPAALATARAAGGGTVAVLNPPATAGPLTAAERARAVDVWQRDGAPEVALRVHDLFLAGELGLDPWRAYAGCQAGDGLAHLGADGEVTACRTLPVALGNLAQAGLREIWAGAARCALRQVLDEAPADCAGCVVAATCRGGCRGLVAVGRRALDLGARDPSCPGPLIAAKEISR